MSSPSPLVLSDPPPATRARTNTSRTFELECQLVFDGSGLVLDYPGLGHRHLSPSVGSHLAGYP